MKNVIKINVQDILKHVCLRITNLPQTNNKYVLTLYIIKILFKYVIIL